MTIWLLKYNNYYNRTIKRYSTIDELLDRDDVVVIGTFENVNFNPGDGVATQFPLGLFLTLNMCVSANIH